MITLKHVSKSFASRLLFRDVTASFASGAVHLILGRNGSGKSTLLRLIGGLSRVTSGSIVFAREDARIGYLGHATFLYPNLTAYENLAFWQKAYGQSAQEQAILKMLAHVGLTPFAHSRVGVFSRGMAQRLSLARVLLLRPDIYLLDEPETGLDKTSRVLLQDEILKARADNACILWVSHLAEGQSLADSICTVQKKTLVCRQAQPQVQIETGGRTKDAQKGDEQC